MTDKDFGLDNVAMVSTGQKKEVTEEFEKQLHQVQTSEPQSLQDMFDRYMKLVYLIDSSGSMGDGMKAADMADQILWSPELLQQFRDRAQQELEDWPYSQDDMDEDEALKDDHDTLKKVAKSLDDNALKLLIVADQLDKSWNIPLQTSPLRYGKSRTKMMAVKDAAKEFVRKRFEKYPDASVLVMPFEMRASVTNRGGGEQTTLDAINQLPDFGGGGTDIAVSVEGALSELKKRPSQLGAHHIVLVSDGLDGGAVRVQEMVERMKELNVVFDFLYIRGATDDQRYQNIIDVLRGVCEATGGEFTTVETEQDFKQKFLEVSNRKCLPPAPSSARK